VSWALPNDRLLQDIVDAAYVIHRAYGPGEPRKLYQVQLGRDLCARGHEVVHDVPKWISLAMFDPPVDLAINDRAVVYVRARKGIPRMYEEECWRAVKWSSRWACGVVINFREPALRDGIYCVE
jgi:PD-(D/E)XK nuclease superfamily protein